LTNARVVLADDVIHGSVLVRDGHIAAIDNGIAHLNGALDLQGGLLVPGLVELHTDNLERHVVPRPQTYWPADAGVIAHDREIVGVGITTVFNAICVGEVHAKSMRVELLGQMADAVERQRAAGALLADHFLHWRCELSYSNTLDMLEPLAGHPRVRLMSLMDHTPGQRQFANAKLYADYYKGLFNFTDDEVAAFMDKRRNDQRTYSGPNRRGIVQMARAHGHCLASHDDATLEHVAEAIDDGVVIAEFPTTREAARAAHEGGIQVLMGGPNLVRGKSHYGNVSAMELAGDGLLDIISSDYVPSSLLYSALVLAASDADVSLPRAIAMATRNPARAVHLDDRGEIAVGLRADLVWFHERGGLPDIRSVWRAGVRVA
jgi:alpha-D-ribose 1-methylphosphonate 5-triphosphate diphosphatase